VVLGVDPGACAGCGLTRPELIWEPSPPKLLWVRTIDVRTRELELAIEEGATLADELGLPFMMATEDWGKGGPLGIDQWLGLGAARGHWERAVILAAEKHPSIRRARPWVRISQTTWRSALMESWGETGPDGKFVRFDHFGWKRAATRTLAELAPTVEQDSSDAAEGGLISFYTSRSDELGKVLPKRVLARAGRTAP
jgi:hypothetical protein